MANLEAWSSVPAVGVHPDGALWRLRRGHVEELFRARYLEMVRLAGLLGADDPEDVAQEAFTRLMNKEPDLAFMTHPFTVTAYDAAGHVVQTDTLGQPE